MYLGSLRGRALRTCVSKSGERQGVVRTILSVEWRRDYAGKSRASKYDKYFRILELPATADKESVRRKYIELVKIYHPDASSEPSEKFSEIDTAYRSLQIKFKEDDAREEASIGEYGLYYQDKGPGEEGEEEVEYDHPDIRHTAPQHRQYLENAGFGYGTPAQRQKQYQKYRAVRANEAVFEHRMSSITARYENRLVTAERKTVKKHTTRNQIDRLVEDLIQESMSSGEFDNLAGKGKPLPDRVDYNPYSDFTTHKMNQILAEGGFAPEWVMLRKEIRDQSDAIRGELTTKRQTLGPAPLSGQSIGEWNLFMKRLENDSVKMVNKQVDKFNLIVPNFNSQMFHFNLTREASKILENGYDPNLKTEEEKAKKVIAEQIPEKGIFQEFIETLFKR